MDIEDSEPFITESWSPPNWIQFKGDITELYSHFKESFPLNNLRHINDWSRAIIKKSGITKITKEEIYHCYVRYCQEMGIEMDVETQLFFRPRNVRSRSGINEITVLTSGYPGIDLVRDIKHYEDIRNAERSGQRVAGQFSCKYDCHFCPKQDGMPRSYLRLEPAVNRAFQNFFDPILQFLNRAWMLIRARHPCDKIELLILGGTFSSYSGQYREDFIRKLFYAANMLHLTADINATDPAQYLDELYAKRHIKTLEEEMTLNSSSKCRIIGLTIETRPNEISPQEIKRFRRWGITRVQLGVQHSHPGVLDRVNRRHYFEDYQRATKMLRDNGFKFDTHLMFDLPPPLDEPNFDMVLADLKFAYKMIRYDNALADQWKIYPCEVVPWTQIEKEFKQGLYMPYTNRELTADELTEKYPYSYLKHLMTKTGSFEDFRFQFFKFIQEYIKRFNMKKYNMLYILIMFIKSQIPEFIRINRLIRDIPDNYWLGGIRNTGVRATLQKELTAMGYKCHCIRCREIGYEKFDQTDICERTITYECCQGIEYFISLITKSTDKLIGFIRLRLGRNEDCVFDELKGCALIRELHVYGHIKCNAPTINIDSVQHHGFGTQLIYIAVIYAKQHGFDKIAVISGEGVRNYYTKMGFKTMGPGRYMIKNITY